jgi:hypothetical protein
VGRLHLFEFNDQPWLPEVLRRAETGYLALVVTKARLFTALAPRLAGLVDGAGCDRIVDLCAGGGGPYPELLRLVDGERRRATELVLTDLHPNSELPARFDGDGAIRAERQPVDARRVPRSLTGVRTLFDGLHHFRPEDVRTILADAAAARAPILIAEASERSVAALLASPLIPLVALAVMPFVRPRSWVALACTYLVPIVPALIFWDGLISCLRSYRVDELGALTEGLEDGYVWDVGVIRRVGGGVTFLVGRPSATTPLAAE